jgi:hypothetical protein
MQGGARSMSNAPQVADSTEEERRAYVKERFPCIADCDQCGFCAAYHGRDPETAYADYIAGKAEFLEVSLRYRR